MLHDQGAHYYSGFSVANEVSPYQMVVTSTPDSNDDDHFENSQGAQFSSTFDREHDEHPDIACAEHYSAGWWYASSIASGMEGNQVHWRDATGGPSCMCWNRDVGALIRPSEPRSRPASPGYHPRHGPRCHRPRSR